MENKLQLVSANPENEKWNNMISRENELYKRKNDMRSEFERDYTRIIHSSAYRRLKHKTQVFFSPTSDHVCTRIEHVNHVESISYTIAKHLGLNTELTRAIATAHDLGHSPFGHEGERILSEICQRDIGEKFWHEKNGLNFVDNIEVLEDNNKFKQNLNLTYAVRDGIISHCGEIDQNGVKPRQEFIDLNDYSMPNEYMPYTWEGCIVKIADKISYIGRDIEDAIKLGLINEDKLKELNILLNECGHINNTIIINELVSDLCQNSSLENGICFSDKFCSIMNIIKEFNYENIYKHSRINPSIRYFKLVINEIYDLLKEMYKGEKTIENLNEFEKVYPNLIKNFKEWLEKYSDLRDGKENLENKIVYKIKNNEKEYYKAIIDYISGMTDNFAIDAYNEIIKF
ncbi:MAG: HD domain-containing protein [Clostridia bacterium]|nr:HD domain-containing protein [Clostridia bacterium]